MCLERDNYVYVVYDTLYILIYISKAFVLFVSNLFYSSLKACAVHDLNSLYLFLTSSSLKALSQALIEETLKMKKQ